MKKHVPVLKFKAPYLYGIHPILAALQNSKRRPKKIYATPEALKHLPKLDIPVQKVEREALDLALGANTTHQGLVLETGSLPTLYLEDLLKEESDKPFLILDQVTDPQNVGAIIRSAAAFGVRALIQQDKNAPDPNNPIIAKTACGGVEHLPQVFVPNLSRAIELLQKHGYWVLGLDERGESSISQIDLKGKTAFVMGREGKGLRRLTKETCDQLTLLPTNPVFPTLNVSNAAAVTLYEWSRQNV